MTNFSLLASTAPLSGAVAPPVASAPGKEIEAFVSNRSNYKAVSTVTTTAGTSIMDALIALESAVTNSYDKHPADRGLLILNPGVYTQRINRALTGRVRIDVISSTLNPADVKMINPDNAEDTFEVSSAQGIICGIYIYSNIAGTQALHMGDSATGADQFVVHKCILEAGPLAGDALSWGANSGQSLFVSDTVIIGGGYTHNFITTKKRTLVQLYNCNLVDTHVILDESGNAGDTFNVIGGSWLGSYGYSAGGNVSNRTWRGLIDPAAGSVPAGSPFTVGAAPYVSPITDDIAWNTYWWPDQRGVPLTQDLFTVSGSQACVADRIYYVPFRVAAAHNSGSAKWTFSTSSGNIQAALLADSVDGLPGYVLWNQTSMAVAPTVTLNGFSRILVPGETYWLAYAVNNATAVGSRGTVPVGTRYLDVAPGTPIAAYPTGTLVASGNALAATMALN